MVLSLRSIGRCPRMSTERSEPYHARLPHPSLFVGARCTFEFQDHSVDARRRHLEEPLEVSLCWGRAVDLRVGVDEGEILALQVSDGSSVGGSARGRIDMIG